MSSMTDSTIISLYYFTKPEWERSNETVIKYIDKTIYSTNKNIEINIPFKKSHPYATNITNWINDKYDKTKNIDLNYLPESETIGSHEDMWMFFYLGKLITIFHDIFCYYVNIFGKRILVLQRLDTNEVKIINKKYSIAHKPFVGKIYRNFHVNINDVIYPSGNRHFYQYNIGELFNPDNTSFIKYSNNESTYKTSLSSYYPDRDKVIVYIIKNIRVHMARYVRGQCFKYPIKIFIFTGEPFSDLNNPNFRIITKLKRDEIKKIQSKFSNYHIFPSYPISSDRMELQIEPKFIVVPNIKSEYLVEDFVNFIPLYYHV